ncbi:N-acetylmuramoyl-L-alanine amidase [Aquifex pyrophilus]
MFPRSFLTFSLLLLIVSFSFSLTLVKVRYGVHKEKIRIVFELNKKVKYRVFALERPYRVVIDIFDRKVKFRKISLPRGIKYRTGTHPWGKRIVLQPSYEYEVKAFSLNRPFRIVIDLYKTLRFKPKFVKKVIVIDAGHGGKDPGAIGWRGIKEKWVNLRIARYLAYYLRKDGRFKVIMTRKGDYFVPLGKRAEIAVRNKAHLFISIHADAAPRKNPRARGTQIFALSHRSAERKKREMLRNTYLAKLLINNGGYKYRSTRLILTDLAFKITLEESVEFAKILARELKRNLKRRVYFKGIKRAGFAVLKTPGTPSVLIEVGFITNPYEARRLASSKFQRRVAYSIYMAILKYFNLKPR